MGVNRTIDITTEEREVVLALLQRHLPGVETWVYGSRAKWTSRPQSDLDLVVFATPEQSHKIGDLREAFEESNLPFRVDLFVWSEVPEQFHQEIKRDHVVLVKTVPVSVDVSFPKITLGTIIEINDSTYSPKEAWPFVNYLDTGNITENCISEIQHLKTGIDTIPSRARRKVRPGDIVYSTVRPNQKHFGYLKIVPENFLVSTGFSVIRGISGVSCTNYIYWFLAQRHIVDHLHTVAEHSTSAYPSIRPTDIEGLTLRLPPLPEQHAIAHILGALDDKIELNRRTNETLESMARALFKSWFVDFDPVRAKMVLKHHSPPQNHSPLEGESQSAIADVVGGITPPLRGSHIPQSGCGGGDRWKKIKRSYPEKTLNRAKSLRQNQTDAEGLLWHYLHNKQLDGYKFRRQQPIGPYIIDFACLSEKLLIELDGGQHAEQEAYDERRDQFLQSKGYRVLRFWNNEVFDNCFAVLEQIYQALINHSPLEGESQSTIADVVRGITPPLRGSHNPQSGCGGGNNHQMAETDAPPPALRRADALVSPTPPQGGSDWTVERARAYLDRMDPEIVDLFPDRLVDSELGEIPEGWEVKILGNLLELTYGKALKAENREQDGEIPVYGSNGQVGWHNMSLVRGPGIVVGRKGNPGTVTWAHSNFFPIDTTFYVVPKNDKDILYFLYFALKSQNLSSLAADSAVPGLNRNLAYMNRQVTPAGHLIESFRRFLSPVFSRSHDLEIESRILTSLRDTLLPKLISGEIRVHDAEKLVDASTS